MNNEISFKDHKFIIAGGDGINPLGIVRSLGEEGINSSAIRLRHSNHWASVNTSKYVTQVDYAKDYEDVYRICVEKYGNEELKPFLFFTDEGNALVFDSHYDEIKEKFIFYNCGSAGKLTHLTDKDAQCKLACECGFRVPTFEIIDKGTYPSKVTYPLITKTINPNEGHWKRDMVVCRNKDELREAYNHIAANKLLVEEYINGVCEVDFKGFSIRGGEEIFFTYQKKWRHNDLSCNYLMFFSPIENVEIKDKISKFIKLAHFTGIFDIEFIQDETGELYFLEVNWRTGQYNYNHSLEGVNLPYLWAKSVVEDKIDTVSIVLKHGPYTTIDEMEMVNALKHRASFKSFLSQIKKANFVYYYNSADNRPFRVAVKNMIKHKLHNQFVKIRNRVLSHKKCKIIR